VYKFLTVGPAFPVELLEAVLMNWGPIQSGAFESLIFSGNKKEIKSKKGTGYFFRMWV
jgi:hypothetical protein